MISPLLSNGLCSFFSLLSGISPYKVSDRPSVWTGITQESRDLAAWNGYDLLVTVPLFQAFDCLCWLPYWSPLWLQCCTESLFRVVPLMRVDLVRIESPHILVRWDVEKVHVANDLVVATKELHV